MFRISEEVLSAWLKSLSYEALGKLEVMSYRLRENKFKTEEFSRYPEFSSEEIELFKNQKVVGAVKAYRLRVPNISIQETRWLLQKYEKDNNLNLSFYY